MKALGFILILVFAGLMLFGQSDLPDRGDLDAPANQEVTPYYIANAYNDVGAPNMVTVVLVDYRGFDTLGETLVIMAAGLAVLLILRSDYRGPEPDARRRQRERKIEGGLGQAVLSDDDPPEGEDAGQENTIDPTPEPGGRP